MHKKLLIPLALLLAISLVAIGCAAEPAPTAPPTTAPTAAPTTAPPEPIKLTFGGLYPPTHPFSLATLDWIEKMKKDTNGRVVIEPFWGAAMYSSKDSAVELGKGVADTGDFSGAYAPAGFDFEKSFRMVYWGLDDRDLARKVYDEVNAKYPELEAEFTKANIKVLCYASVPPYNLATVKKAVRSTGDFKGLILKTTGDLGKLAATLGAEGTTIGMGETYVALQKNTIDGGFITDETLSSFKFAEVVKYYTKLDISSAPAGHWGMSMNTWNKLPPDIQKVFDDNRLYLGLKVEELAFAENTKGIALGEQLGVEFIKLSDAELQKVYDAADKIVREEMAALDAKGLPGTKVYNDMRLLIKQGK